MTDLGVRKGQIHSMTIVEKKPAQNSDELIISIISLLSHVKIYRQNITLERSTRGNKKPLFDLSNAYLLQQIRDLY
jgi:hypothetical protein